MTCGTTIIPTLIAAAALGCSEIRLARPVSDPSEDRERVTEELPADLFATHGLCASAWESVLDEWIEAGGGMKNSVVAMRVQIAEDRASRFSSMVRSIWRKQLIASGAMSEAGRHEDMAAIQIETQLHGLPQECNNPGWLIPALWDYVVLDANRNVSQPPTEWPRREAWQSSEAQQWLYRSLLGRAEAAR